jgi:uncharacterized protein with PIN domain
MARRTSFNHPTAAANGSSCPACGKKIYDTRDKAARQAARMRRVFGERFTWYRCPSGTGMFHVGHVEGNREQRGQPRLEPPASQRNSYRKDIS